MSPDAEPLRVMAVTVAAPRTVCCLICARRFPRGHPVLRSRLPGHPESVSYSCETHTADEFESAYPAHLRRLAEEIERNESPLMAFHVEPDGRVVASLLQLGDSDGLNNLARGIVRMYGAHPLHVPPRSPPRNP